MITRRSFLKNTAGISFVSGPWFTGRVFAQGTADMGVITSENIDKAVRAAVAAVGGMGAFVKKGDQVVLKPNLSFGSKPERAATTNPEVLKSLITICLEAGAKRVVVIDHPLNSASVIKSPSSQVPVMVKSMKNAVLFLPTTENMYRETAILKGKTIKSVKVASILKQSDVLINVPVAKSHSATHVSLSIKGNLGLVWDRARIHNIGLDPSLADLATVIKADLTVVDAVRALTTRGPQGPGKVVNLNTIIAGKDPVAVDSCAVALTPWNNKKYTGKDITHLKLSHEMGLGEIDLSKLNILRKTV